MKIVGQIVVTICLDDDDDRRRKWSVLEVVCMVVAALFIWFTVAALWCWLVTR